MESNSDMQQFRCPTCNKLMFKYKLEGYLKLEIKCTRCDKYIKYETSRLKVTNDL